MSTENSVLTPQNPENSAIQTKKTANTQESTDPPKRQKKKFKWTRKKIIISSVIGVIVLLCAVGLYNLFKPKTEPIATDFVTRGSLESTVKGYGTAIPKEKADISISASGKVLDVFVKSGDVVQKGDPLFIIDSSELDDQILEAQTDLNRAQTDLTNAQKRVNNLKVTAPFAGKTINVEKKVGNTVSEGDKLALLVDDSKMRLKLYFIYSYVNVIKPGMSATVSIPQTMASVSGSVSSVEKVKKITPEGAVLFQAEIIINNPGALTKDMIATAVVNGPNGPIMPSEAGKLEYNQEIEIATKVSGELTSVSAKDYYEFSKGATLFTLDNSSVIADVGTYNKAYESKLKAFRELEKKRAEYQAAAPISGTVLSSSIKAGDELVSGSSQVVMSIANLDTMLMNIQIDEMDIGKLSAGMEAKVTQDTGDGKEEGGKEFYGTLTSVSLEGKSENGMSFFSGVVELDGAEGLMTGMSLNYSITTSYVEDALLIPAQSAIYTDDGVVAYVKKSSAAGLETIELPPDTVPDGFVAVPIEIGQSSETNVEVLSGLEEGMEIYTVDVSQDEMYGGMYY